MIAVICGSKRDFDDFIKPWVHKEDQSLFVCVSRMIDLDFPRSYKINRVVRIGNLDNISNHDLSYINDKLAYLTSINNKAV